MRDFSGDLLALEEIPDFILCHALSICIYFLSITPSKMRRVSRSASSKLQNPYRQPCFHITVPFHVVNPDCTCSSEASSPNQMVPYLCARAKLSVQMIECTQQAKHVG